MEEAKAANENEDEKQKEKTTTEKTTTEELSFEKEETVDYASQDEARKIEWDGANSPIGLFRKTKDQKSCNMIKD